MTKFNFYFKQIQVTLKIVHTMNYKNAIYLFIINASRPTYTEQSEFSFLSKNLGAFLNTVLE